VNSELVLSQDAQTTTATLLTIVRPGHHGTFYAEDRSRAGPNDAVREIVRAGGACPPGWLLALSLLTWLRSPVPSEPEPPSSGFLSKAPAVAGPAITNPSRPYQSIWTAQ
jgi:hypothetical protein